MKRNKITDRIRLIRGRLAQLGLSQHDLATALGLSQPTVNAILTGRRSAPAGFKARAIRALNWLEHVELAAAEARAKAVEEMGARRVQPGRRRADRCRGAARGAVPG